MGYFLANLFRDKVLWGMLGLAAVAGLTIVDLLTFMLTPRAVFNLWTVKMIVGAGGAGTIVYGLFLYRREKRDKRLAELLPGFLNERRGFLEKRAAAGPEFLTLCHQCRHFDLERLGCLLVLRQRQSWIKLNEESLIAYCLYWNLDDGHPVMALTRRLKRKRGDGERPAERQGG